MVSVVIGVDPHKRSATIVVLDQRERLLGQGRFGTDNTGYQALLAHAAAWPQRVWAVEGCNGVGKHLSQRLVADGETVVDVPAKLSARTRVFSTGHGRKTDNTDARSVALVALRTEALNRVVEDDHTVALRLLVDRRDELGRARTDTVNRLHKLLAELIPGGAKKFLSAAQARRLLAGVRPRNIVGKTRRALAADLVAELAGLDRKMKTADKHLDELLDATGTTLRDLYGIGPSSDHDVSGTQAAVCLGVLGKFEERLGDLVGVRTTDPGQIQPTIAGHPLLQTLCALSPPAHAAWRQFGPADSMDYTSTPSRGEVSPRLVITIDVTVVAIKPMAHTPVCLSRSGLQTQR